jgi:hypothetical protein
MLLRNRAISVQLVKTPKMDISDNEIDNFVKNLIVQTLPTKQTVMDVVKYSAAVFVIGYSAKRVIDLATHIAVKVAEKAI